jgi:hypothetical protein
VRLWQGAFGALGPERRAPAGAAGAAECDRHERAGRVGGHHEPVARQVRARHLVGFRLTRNPATTGTRRDDVVELALDFNCQRRAWKGAQRARDSLLVQRILPDDAELAKLR